MIEKIKIIQGDCIEILQEIENNSVDLVVTDPPYFTPPAQFVSGRSNHKRSLSNLSLLDHFYSEFFQQLIPKLKQTGSIYIFCDAQSYPLYYCYLYEHVKRLRLLVWDRGTAINGYTWRYRCQYILFAEMFDAPSIKTGDGDLLQYRSVPVKKRLHPAEKPLDLVEALIMKSSDEGDLILDCFAGSGVIPLICQNKNRRCVAIELSANYYNLMKNRVKTE